MLNPTDCSDLDALKSGAYNTDAWALYCAETAGSMHVRDFWEELPQSVQLIYVNKARQAAAR